MVWQKQKPEFYESEVSTVRRRFPDISIKERQGLVHFEGLFPVMSESGSILRQYHLRVVFPSNYPDWIPDSFLLESSVERIAERHIEKDGRACLCLPHEIPIYFNGEIRFEAYFDRLLTPWLIGQMYYDKHGHWPWSTREHGKDGIIRGFSELLGIEDKHVVERFARLLVRKNKAKGHEPCPCGSGRKLRDCHSDLYYQCRECIPKEAIIVYRNIF